MIDLLTLRSMRPDYAHKVFADQRNSYVLLVEALSMDHLIAE